MEKAVGAGDGATIVPDRAHGTRRRIVLGLLTLLVVVVVTFSVWHFIRPTPVDAMRVSRGSVAQVVYATGFVEPDRPIKISSRITAPVDAVLVDEGARVARGQPLAILDSVDARQLLAQSRAQRIGAEQDEQRALAIYRKGFLARSALDPAIAAANAARAAEAAAQARLDQSTIRAALSGTILKRDIEPGDLATPTKTLFELGDPNLLRVTATVDERDIPLVRRGAAAMMSSDAFPGKVIRGRVMEITPGGDPDQRAFRVRLRPESTSILPIGLTLEVNIMVSQDREALLVPLSAIKGSALWVVRNGRAERHAIVTGIRGADRVQIIRGVDAGACVIAKPAANLKDGQRVAARGC